ncbi:MAG: type II secretion system protein [Phycisphaerae bacterium]
MCPNDVIVKRCSLRGSPAFTLIELLAVFAIVLILISAILVGGPRLIDKARARTTESLLRVVDSAVDEFRREQTENPSIVSVKQHSATGNWVSYERRYGRYPPDELEVFTAQGLPGSAQSYSLAVGKASVIPAPAEGNGAYAPMRFYTGGDSKPELEHRDLAAMILAIEMFSPKAAVILDHIPESQRSPGVLDETGKPIQFLDRNGDGEWAADVAADLDLQIRYIVDTWGVPLTYLAQRDYDPDDPDATRSSNHASWNQASTELIRLNGGRPIIMSYGPDGPRQLVQDVQQDATANLVGDWADQTPGVPRIDNTFNQDNIYANPDLAAKLVERASQE